MASITFAQQQAPYTKVLVPVVLLNDTPGAYGSIWSTKITVRNDADQVVAITEIPTGACIPPCGEIPNSTFTFVGGAVANPSLGAFIYIGAPGRDQVSFSMRVFDKSRESTTWGTALPVVTAADTYSETFHLLDVPFGPGFRTALRIYDFDGQDAAAIRIRIFDLERQPQGEVAIVDTNLQLAATNPLSRHPLYPAQPAALLIGDLVAAFPELLAIRSARIELTPVSPTGHRFWTFTAATHNETQHVTAILPAAK